MQKRKKKYRALGRSIIMIIRVIRVVTRLLHVGSVGFEIFRWPGAYTIYCYYYIFLKFNPCNESVANTWILSLKYDGCNIRLENPPARWVLLRIRKC